MSFQEIVEKLPELSHDEKLKLVELLQLELAAEQLTPNTSYEVWSPFDAFEAADTLQRLLDEHKKKQA